MRRIPAMIVTLGVVWAQEARARADYRCTTLTPPSATSSFAYGINDRGDVVGAYLGEDENYHGFLLSGGTYTSLSVPGAGSTYATGISQLGQIVGYYAAAAGNTHGFLDSGGAFSTLDVPGAAGQTYADGVNVQGQVVGGYTGADGSFHGFVATPAAVPAPAAIVTLAGGAGAVLAAAALRRGRTPGGRP